MCFLDPRVVLYRIVWYHYIDTSVHHYRHTIWPINVSDRGRERSKQRRRQRQKEKKKKIRNVGLTHFPMLPVLFHLIPCVVDSLRSRHSIVFSCRSSLLVVVRQIIMEPEYDTGIVEEGDDAALHSLPVNLSSMLTPSTGAIFHPSSASRLLLYPSDAQPQQFNSSTTTAATHQCRLFDFQWDVEVGHINQVRLIT